jgi:hypothetical protein
VVVDRIDVKPGLPGAPPGQKFGERVVELGDHFDALLVQLDVQDNCNEPGNMAPWHVWNYQETTHLAQFVSASRMWRPVDSEILDNERNPRFVFANRHVYRSDDDDNTNFVVEIANDQIVDAFTISADPDFHVPDFSRRQDDVPGLFDDFDFPLQMLQKDGDFDQVGELLDVWLQAHELAFQGPGYDHTETTFSEFMREDRTSLHRANRLRMGSELVGLAKPVAGPGGPVVPWDDPMHTVPAVPAGVRVFDAFVCDGPGIGELSDLDGDGSVDEDDARLRRFLNANEFSGALTPGLVNLNTASREVLRSVPNWFRAVHESVHEYVSPELNPVVRLPEAVVQYRERQGALLGEGDPLPAYSDRGSEIVDNPADPSDDHWRSSGFRVGLRSDRGMASIGELLLLERAGKTGKEWVGNQILYDDLVFDPIQIRKNILDNSSFQIDYPTLREREVFEQEPQTPPLPPDVFLFPIEIQPGQWAPRSARVSGDVVNRPDDDQTPPLWVSGLPDEVAEDAEEANVLFAGASNVLTTRSDVFTVYFRIRSFRQNPVSGVWDATDPESIVEENRYVMLVDRSEVNRPSDRPKILYVEQLPP